MYFLFVTKYFVDFSNAIHLEAMEIKKFCCFVEITFHAKDY